MRRGIQDAIYGGVTHDDLNVVARFGERNGFDEFVHVGVSPFGLPEFRAILAGIIRGERDFGRVELLEQVGEIECAEL